MGSSPCWGHLPNDLPGSSRSPCWGHLPNNLPGSSPCEVIYLTTCRDRLPAEVIYLTTCRGRLPAEVIYLTTCRGRLPAEVIYLTTCRGRLPAEVIYLTTWRGRLPAEVIYLTTWRGRLPAEVIYLTTCRGRLPAEVIYLTTWWGRLPAEVIYLTTCRGPGASNPNIFPEFNEKVLFEENCWIRSIAQTCYIRQPKHLDQPVTLSCMDWVGFTDQSNSRIPFCGNVMLNICLTQCVPGCQAKLFSSSRFSSCSASPRTSGYSTMLWRRPYARHCVTRSTPAILHNEAHDSEARRVSILGAVMGNGPKATMSLHRVVGAGKAARFSQGARWGNGVMSRLRFRLCTLVYTILMSNRSITLKGLGSLWCLICWILVMC